MELWIRSQDKGKLIKVNSVYLPNPINANNFFPKIIANDGDYLGSYKTTKRALEVLDEIQKHITINATITGNYEEQDTKIKSLMLGYQIRIFEMPEK